MTEPADEAADRSVDDDRLLEGEDPQTSYLEDATHWVTVYSELLGVKRDLLGVAEERLHVLEPPVRREIASTDLVVLDAEMKRFSRRLEFWRARCLELGGSPRA
jgi:hypothetical protein